MNVASLFIPSTEGKPQARSEWQIDAGNSASVFCGVELVRPATRMVPTPVTWLMVNTLSTSRVAVPLC